MTCKCYRAEKNFLGEIGVCWGTKECDACSCGGDEAKCNFYGYVRERAKKQVTNADRIRAMTDEELADWIRHIECRTNFYGKEGFDYWLEWLRQEASDHV